MEATSLTLASAAFEKLGIFNAQFLKDVLIAIFSSLHFYRNNTKSKSIPTNIIKAVHVFFATFIVNNSVDTLV